MDRKVDVMSWRMLNPDGGKNECARQLHISRNTVRKYWNDSLFPEKEKPKPAREIVEEWLLKNPNRRKADCIRETGISGKTVAKYWNNVAEKET